MNAYLFSGLLIIVASIMLLLRASAKHWLILLIVAVIALPWALGVTNGIATLFATVAYLVLRIYGKPWWTLAAVAGVLIAFNAPDSGPDRPSPSPGYGVLTPNSSLSKGDPAFVDTRRGFSVYGIFVEEPKTRGHFNGVNPVDQDSHPLCRTNEGEFRTLTKTGCDSNTMYPWEKTYNNYHTPNCRDPANDTPAVCRVKVRWRGYKHTYP